MEPYFPPPDDPKGASPFRKPAEAPLVTEPPKRAPAVVSRPSPPQDVSGKGKAFASLNSEQKRAYARAVAEGVSPPGYRPSVVAAVLLVVVFVLSIVVRLPGGRYGRRLAWGLVALGILGVDFLVSLFRKP